MKQITENVYLVGGAGISHEYDCLVYLVKLKHACVLIDTGCGLKTELIDKNISLLGYPTGPEIIILTHCHIDHVGGAYYFKQKYNSKIYSSLVDAYAIEGQKIKLVAADFYNISYNPVKVDEKISLDSSITIFDQDFLFLLIPGHTPGSIAVIVEIDNEKIIFAQDLHGPFLEEWGSSKKEWKESLKRILNYRPTILCEGHYGIYRGAEAEDYIKRFL